MEAYAREQMPTGIGDFTGTMEDHLIMDALIPIMAHQPSLKQKISKYFFTKKIGSLTNLSIMCVTFCTSFRHVRDFVLAHKDNLKFFNTIHSYSQLVLIPYGFTSNTDEVPGYDKIFDLATKVRYS